MPASRIMFAIGDLVAELKRLQPRGENDPAPITAELHLDESLFGTVVGAIENHYNQALVRDMSRDRIEVSFGGLRIVSIFDIDRPEAAALQVPTRTGAMAANDVASEGTAWSPDRP